MLPYTLSADNSFKQFQAAHLDSNTTYDRNFGNRKVARYGNMPYEYPGGRHEARDISTNTYLANIVNHLNSLFPDRPKPFNSFLVTKMPMFSTPGGTQSIARGSSLSTLETRHSNSAFAERFEQRTKHCTA